MQKCILARLSKIFKTLIGYPIQLALLTNHSSPTPQLSPSPQEEPQPTLARAVPGPDYLDLG